MSHPEKIVRPLWRSFDQRFLKNAVSHVKSGGHAVVRRPEASSRGPVHWMLLPCDRDGDVGTMAFWSMLSLDKRNWEQITRGVASGLATMRIPRAYEAAVEEWCERDAKWPGSTRAMDLDCMTCAACCKSNRVLLDDDDYGRWHKAKRDDLAMPPFTRTVEGKVMLNLRKDGDCVHLDGTLCGIYELRPDNCRIFPAGTEPCLASRLEEFAIDD